MFESKETIDQNENKLIGSTSLPPIVDRFYGPLYQFAVRLTRSESDAADLVQQTFFTLIQHLHQIRDLSRIKCWLFTTLRRKFLMEVRHRANHPEVEFLPDVHSLLRRQIKSELHGKNSAAASAKTLSVISSLVT
jgi:DNA-directed RNA polymerase specialized sigma24 family protein